jgi:uncharacterized membrane protein YkvA (DUF1232 family)
MTVAFINQKISSAIRHEEATHSLAQHLRATVQTRGLSITDEALLGVVGSVRAYVESAPVLLEAARAAAANAGVLDQLRPLFDAATAYFLEPNDLIPDALGLVGVVDDAYLAYALISAASQRSLERTGRHLIEFPPVLIHAHLEIRTLLGPVAIQLEGYVAAKLLELFPALLAHLAGVAPTLRPQLPLAYNSRPTTLDPNKYAALMVSAVTGG